MKEKYLSIYHAYTHAYKHEQRDIYFSSLQSITDNYLTNKQINAFSVCLGCVCVRVCVCASVRATFIRTSVCLCVNVTFIHTSSMCVTLIRTLNNQHGCVYVTLIRTLNMDMYMRLSYAHSTWMCMSVTFIHTSSMCICVYARLTFIHTSSFACV